jgi:hypothetical protein
MLCRACHDACPMVHELSMWGAALWPIGDALFFGSLASGNWPLDCGRPRAAGRTPIHFLMGHYEHVGPWSPSNGAAGQQSRPATARSKS